MSPTALDATHDLHLRSWVESANGHHAFAIQNLPFGIFSPPDGTPRAGIAIGDEILDLPAALACGLFDGEAAIAARAAVGTSLNAFLALGAGPRKALRQALSRALTQGSPEEARLAPALYDAEDCTLHVPAEIGDYTDFYAGIHHAKKVGALFRPDAPLLPNYKHIPIGYHGRASSIRASGGAVHRPNGQRKPAHETEPSFGPCRNLDYELELGIWIGPGNALGEPIAIGDAATHIAGFCLLNDFSARDIQGWEYQPLGPFLAKSFATIISPWIITPEALAPFRAGMAARPEGDPTPLPYLLDAADQESGSLDLTLEVFLLTPAMRSQSLPPHRLSVSNVTDLYWTTAQMVAHHTSNGCNLRPGDIFGSGTISGENPDQAGSLLELTSGGRQKLTLPSGETRAFLEDGDEVLLRATAIREGAVSIGFGECTARIG